MNRRALGGVMLAVLAAAVFWGGFAWWRAWSAPLVTVALRPAFSVEGISSGTPVRVKGVTVGQVASIGLVLDTEGRLRPVVNLSLDPSMLEDRGFADRLRGDQLHDEVALGLRARLMAVNRASGMLQVELIWEAPSTPPPGLTLNEIPMTGGTMQRTIEQVAQQLETISNRDLVALAASLEGDLDAFYPATDPARAVRFSSMLMERTGSVVAATGESTLGAQSARLSSACTRLREAVAVADRKLDDETLVLLQVRLADAGTALASFSAALEGSRASMNSASGEVSDLFRAVSEKARQWTKKAASLTTEPQSR
jgi:hypothetical protein